MAFSQEIRDQAVAEVIDGMSPPKVARKYGIHHTTVHRWAVAAGLDFRPGRSAHLTARMERAERGLRDGLPVAEVARRMSVAPQTIRTWHGKMSMTTLRRGRDGGATTTGHSIVGTTAPAGTIGRGKRLCLAERIKIAEGLAEGASAATIAAVLDRPRQTIAREINRSSSPDGVYQATSAHQQAMDNLVRPKVRKLDADPVLRAEVVYWLDHDTSPEQIMHRLRYEFGTDETMQISHEAIYQALYVHGQGALRQELKKETALRSGRTHRIPRSKLAGLPGRGRKSWVEGAEIDTRPEEVEGKLVAGHWEGDLIIGGDQRTALITLAERHSRFVLIKRLGVNHESATAVDGLTDLVRDLPGHLCRTITWDQGVEMAECARFTVATDCQMYFAHPHSPWERGLNENSNGLIREYFPKGTTFDGVTDADVQFAQDRLNGRPRVVLHGQTPAERLGEIINGALTA